MLATARLVPETLNILAIMLAANTSVFGYCRRRNGRYHPYLPATPQSPPPTLPPTPAPTSAPNLPPANPSPPPPCEIFRRTTSAPPLHPCGIAECNICSNGFAGDVPRTIELFVTGRICLFGEHSDWAGGQRGSLE